MRVRALLFRTACNLFVLAMGVHSASAITIVRNFISNGNPIPNTGINATAAPATVGGGNLTAVVNAAADWWEAALLDNGHTLTINFGWGDPSNPGFIAQHALVTQGGAPNRETQGSLRFRSDGSVNWYLDPTPRYHTEWTSWANGNINFGGGAISTDRRATGPTGFAAGNTDVFTTALHEIGHALGLSTSNTAYQAESWPNNLVTVTAPRPNAGSNLPTNNSAIPTIMNSTSNAHFPAGTLPNAVMQPGIGGGVRRLLTHADILANAEISQFTNINLNPFMPALTASDLDFGTVRVGTQGMATLTATNTGDQFSTLAARFPDLFTVFQPQTELAFTLIDGDSDSRDYTYTPVARSNNGSTTSMDSNAGSVNVDVIAQGVGPVFGYEIDDVVGIRTDDPLPNGVSNGGGTFDVSELIDLGTADWVIGPDTVSATLTIDNTTPDTPEGDKTTLTILDLQLLGDPADVAMFEIVDQNNNVYDLGVGGDTPVELAAGNASELELLISFTADGMLANGLREVDLLVLTDQGAALGGNGADFLFNVQAVQTPEPAALALWSLLGLLTPVGVLYRRRVG